MKILTKESAARLKKIKEVAAKLATERKRMVRDKIEEIKDKEKDDE